MYSQLAGAVPKEVCLVCSGDDGDWIQVPTGLKLERQAYGFFARKCLTICAYC